MNTTHKDRLIYIKNTINKVGAKRIALLISELIKKDNAKKPRKKSF